MNVCVFLCMLYISIRVRLLECAWAACMFCTYIRMPVRYIGMN